jgi:hypothetical protein
VRRPARLERTQSCRSNWRETCWRVDHCRAGARGQRCLGYLAELKLWTTPKFLKCERYSATAVPVHPVWSLAIAGARLPGIDLFLRPSCLGERILTRVGHYRVTSTLCDGMTTRAVSTNRLQRLVQGDFTEPSAVLMR